MLYKGVAEKNTYLIEKMLELNSWKYWIM